VTTPDKTNPTEDRRQRARELVRQWIAAGIVPAGDEDESLPYAVDYLTERDELLAGLPEYKDRPLLLDLAANLATLQLTLHRMKAADVNSFEPEQRPIWRRMVEEMEEGLEEVRGHIWAAITRARTGEPPA